MTLRNVRQGEGGGGADGKHERWLVAINVEEKTRTKQFLVGIERC